MAVVAPERRGAAGRAAVGTELAALRLGELRSGVWARPANLRREWPDSLRDRVWRFEVRPFGSSPMAPTRRDSAAPVLRTPDRRATVAPAMAAD